MTSLNPGRAVLAGLAGTAVMTMLMVAAPMMGLPPMPIGEMLGQFLQIGSAAGWAMHFVIGTMLALIYATVFAGRIPGAPALRGALYGVGVFFPGPVGGDPDDGWRGVLRGQHGHDRRKLDGTPRVRRNRRSHLRASLGTTPAGGLRAETDEMDHVVSTVRRVCAGDVVDELVV